uniref:Chemosensory protein 6 n=1 Tax=Encarsia formosa TaxID=32400 RepID=A0A6M5CI60_ENCFO|nr:chemosensory protein 6 [Encarsia formosa]
MTSYKTQFALLMVVFLATTYVQAQNIDVMLRNRQLVQRQIKCVLKKAPCDAIGKQIVAQLPEALYNDCRRCKPQDAQNSRKLLAFMQKNYPNELQQMYIIYKPQPH